MPELTHKLYIGLMSGTSCDGVDASLIRTDGLNFFQPIHDVFLPYEPNMQQQIKKLFYDSNGFLAVEKSLTEHHLNAVKTLLAESNHHQQNIEAIGFHGQTIRHLPSIRTSWQIGNPHILAKNLQIKTIHDFRRGDLITGGQGAPLMPIFHQLLMQNQVKPCVVINIGGVANLTYLDQDQLIAFDTGPGNALINDFVQEIYQIKFDINGKIAQKGVADQQLINLFLQDKYYNKLYPKSLDRNDFNYVFTKIKQLKSTDAVATLTLLTSSSILQGLKLLPKKPLSIFLCGGGARNITLVAQLQQLLKINLPSTILANIEQLDNIKADYIESQGFGYLAARFMKNIASTFATTTGTNKENICGSLTLP